MWRRQRIRIAVLTLLIALLGAVQVGSDASRYDLLGETLRNIAYSSKWTRSGKVQLVNGVYTGGAAPNSGTHITVKLSDAIARGRLRGQAAAAVILITDPGGSGTFYDLAVVQMQGHRPANVAATGLGDRIRIIGVNIAKGIIEVDLVRHGPAEPMCCPTMRVREEYALKNGKLVMVSSVPTQSDRTH